MKTVLKRPILGFIFMVLLGLYSTIAQEKKDEEISVQITKEVDGEIKTYKKAYASEEEMEADEELRAFIGDRGQMPYWFSDEEGNKAIKYQDSTGGGQHSFSFNHNGEEDLSSSFRIFQPGDSTIREFELHLRKLSEELTDMDIELREKIRVLEEEGTLAFNFGDTDFNFDFSLPDSLSKRLNAHAYTMRVHADSIKERVKRDMKAVKISEDVDTFGKFGKVKKEEKLELKSISFFPNPAPNGRFKLKLESEEKGELSVSIYNHKEKQIFNRYIENFSGRYSEAIDLSSQSEGEYLLEVQLDDQRLTRKITIE